MHFCGKSPWDIKSAKSIKESESGLEMEIGDQWSHSCASWEHKQISEYREFSKNSKCTRLDFWFKCIFCQTKIFET